MTQKRVNALNVSSEHSVTLVRKKDTRTIIALHTEQSTSVNKKVLQTRNIHNNLATEETITLHRDTRLRERLLALEARVTELEENNA